MEKTANKSNAQILDEVEGQYAYYSTKLKALQSSVKHYKIDLEEAEAAFKENTKTAEKAVDVKSYLNKPFDKFHNAVEQHEAVSKRAEINLNNLKEMVSKKEQEISLLEKYLEVNFGKKA
jgi:chromosome segregation ATPase